MAQRLKPVQAEQVLVTRQSSLQQVKTLLDAGIGCITYLRGLFPEEAFDDHKLLAPRPPLSRDNTAAKHSTQKKDDTPMSVRVKKLRRGTSVEADKLMDYLDKGATEAIEKGYLHQLIFAIYLDPDHPSDLVECYTFTFSYETDEQGNKHPELVVQNQLSGMVISQSGASGFAAKPDQPRKEGEVKRQVQQMIKNLITSTQLLDELPRRRFLTIRLFYTDETPDEYEPPCFKPVSIAVPGYTLSTPLVSDVPDFGTLGSLSTGYHGVALHTVSIAHLLDVPYDESLSRDEAVARNQQDATTRAVVWDAESLASTVTDEDAKLVSPKPVAIKDKQGAFLSPEHVLTSQSSSTEALRQMVGMEMDTEVFVAKGELEETLVESHVSDNENLRRAIAANEPPLTRFEDATQPDPSVSRQRSYRPPVPFFDETNEQYALRLSQDAGPGAGASQPGPSELGKIAEDEEMHYDSADGPAAETQLFDYSQVAPEPARFADESSGAEPDTLKTAVGDSKQHPGELASKKKGRKEVSVDGGSPPRRKSSRKRFNASDDACECGDKADDGAMICCGTCDVWKHAVCYGYTTLDDTRIPDDFVCYTCRARAGLAESMLDAGRESEIEEALADLRSLALFRRAIAIVWQEGVLGMKELAKRLEVDNATAAQVLKRLQNEGFICEQAPPSRRLKGKGNSQVASLKKPVLIVDKTPRMVKKKRNDYFNPGLGAEYNCCSMLDLTDADADGEADVAACLLHNFHPPAR
ncbi:hypothetical protein JCM10207_007337 [Rhodosporidiobolus poonsookiae]